MIFVRLAISSSIWLKLNSSLRFKELSMAGEILIIHYLSAEPLSKCSVLALSGSKSIKCNKEEINLCRLLFVELYVFIRGSQIPDSHELFHNQLFLSKIVCLSCFNFHMMPLVTLCCCFTARRLLVFPVS